MACSFSWRGGKEKTGRARTASNGFQSALKRENVPSMWNHFSTYRQVLEEQRKEHAEGFDHSRGHEFDYSAEDERLNSMLREMSEVAFDKIVSAESYSSELDSVCEILQECLRLAERRGGLGEKERSRYASAIERATAKFSI